MAFDPTKGTKARKEKALHLTLTLDDFQTLNEAAKDAGISKNAWVAAAIRFCAARQKIGRKEDGSADE